MKQTLVALSALVVLSTPSAFAVDAFRALDRDADHLATLLESGTEDDQGQECKLVVLRANEGPGQLSMSIAIQSANGREVSIHVTEQDAIALTVEGDQFDSTKTYAIDGVGTVKIVSADDAYEEISIRTPSVSGACGVYR